MGDAAGAITLLVSASMREFLVWVAFRPRTEADCMAAWQTHCPRFTVWEDALDDGLVAVESVSGRLGSARVGLTARGRAALEVEQRAPHGRAAS